MEITAEWTDQSKQQLREIFDYYATEAGLEVAPRIIDCILKRVEILLNNSQAGPVEPLLAEYHRKYRYLVGDNYKIIRIYCSGNDDYFVSLHKHENNG
jgi:plasmid stabilization system protein ParE